VLVGGREVVLGVLLCGKWFFSTLLWCLWLERNARCFQDSNRPLEEFTAFFFYTLFTWTAAWLALLVISYSDFLVLFSSTT
jgi:hypothetical protein